MRCCLLSLLVSVGIVGLSSRAAADDLQPGAIDEATLVAAIEEGDPRIARIDAAADAVAAEIHEARLRAEPRLAIEREEVFVAGDGLATQSLRLVVPIDVSGRRSRRIDAATATATAARAGAELDRFALVVDGLQIARGAVYARLRVELLASERGALVRALDIVGKRVRAGDAAGYDVQRLELELGNYDDAANDAAIELGVARRRIADLVGRAGELVDVTGDLSLSQGSSRDGRLEETLARRGDYRAAKLRIDAATSARAEAGRAWVPTLELTAGAMAADTGTDTAYGYVAGLSLSLPIFDRGQAAGARAEAARRAAVADARVLEREVPAAIARAQAAVDARVARARAFQTAQLSRLDALLHTAETGYRESGGSITELLDAYRLVRDARLHDLELRHEASLAELDLWRAMGWRP